MVLTAVFMVMLLGFVALSFDVGHFILVKHRLISIVDAAALAGGINLPYNTQTTTASQEVLTANGIPPTNSSMTVDSTTGKLTISASRPVSLTFASVFGINSVTETASAVVGQTGPLSILRFGTFPWGIQLPTNSDGTENFQLGVEYKLKTGSQTDPAPGPNSGGNYYALDLNQITPNPNMPADPTCTDEDYNQGAESYSTYIYNSTTGQFGYPCETQVGDMPYTKTGNMVGPTKTGIDAINNAASAPQFASDTWQSFDHNDPRICLVPIISAIGNGHTQVKIEGYGAFWLLPTSNGQEIDGLFVRYATPNGVSIAGDGNNYGVTGFQFFQ